MVGASASSLEGRRLRRGVAAAVVSGLLVAGYVVHRDILDVLPDRFPSLPLDTGPHGWPAPSGGATQLAAGGAATCARMKSGEVWCWGALGLELGQDKIHAASGDISGWPLRVAAGIESVFVGRMSRCALRADRVLVCRRRVDVEAKGAAGDVVIPEVKEAALGAEHACARRLDDTWVCWGDNRAGQLGDGTTTPRATPAPMPDLPEVTRMALGFAHSCALTRAGAVLCWGAGDMGQLGDGTTSSRATPAPVPGLDDVAQIAAAAMHTCALSRRGTVRCWGLGRSDTAPDAPPAPRPMAVPGIADAVAITAGHRESCALRRGGRVVCWRDLDGEPRRVRHLSDVAALAAGDDHTCALLRDGNVACWGSNGAGKLGTDLGGSNERASAEDIAVGVRWTAPGAVTWPVASASPW